MSTKSHFRGRFDKQHGKRIQTLLKSKRQHLYHVCWSLRTVLSLKKSLLVIWKILGLFSNTLNAHDKYHLLNREDLTQPIWMQLSQKEKKIDNFFLHFWNLNWILNISQRKMTFIADVFPKLGLPKTWLGKCLKSPVSRDPLTSNMGNGPKHSLNPEESTFTIFIDHCKSNWVESSLS